MKLSVFLENDENIVSVPLVWLTLEDRQNLHMECEVIPIPGYQETLGFRAFKIIGPFLKLDWWIKELSISIWQDWKLTAKYANSTEEPDSTAGIQMFNRLDDDEKIQALTINWFQNTADYIIKYFEDHPDLQKRAKKSLKREEIHEDFKDLFR